MEDVWEVDLKLGKDSMKIFSKIGKPMEDHEYILSWYLTTFS